MGTPASRDEAARGLAVLLAVALLTAGVVEFARRHPGSKHDALPVFVYEGVSVEIPALRSNPRIDVNTASPDELTQLPGIGPELASRIVAARETIGSFQTLEQLTQVKGIGPATVDGLRDRACVGPASADADQ